jgi:hypothetical protein
MKWLGIAALLAVLSACAPMATQKVDAGAKTVERMMVDLDGAWNEVTVAEWNSNLRATLDIGPAHVWTMEGLPIDRLLIYSGIKDGQAIHPEPSDAKLKTFKFRSGMQADEIVALFEGMLTRDGSSFKLLKLEPAAFGGGKGLRFEYAVVRKVDNVPLSGLAYATVNDGELFAIVYSAPRLGFFPRYRGQVEHIAHSARIMPAGKAAAR